MRHPKAVLFDLYDILTYADRRRYEKRVNTCAKICTVRAEEFSTAWKSLFVASNLGEFSKTLDCARAALRMLGVSECRDAVDALTKTKHDFLKFGIRLFNDVISMLVSLRKDGLKLTLVTNASPLVRVVLTNCRISEYMDCTIVYSDVGYRKSDARIYEITMRHWESRHRIVCLSEMEMMKHWMMHTSLEF